MMPLSMASPGEEKLIKKVGGNPETRQFLQNLGFVPGTNVSVVSKISGNIIVSIMESRIAISREMATKIFV